MQTNSAGVAMRTIAASIIVLAGAIITSTWVICQAIGPRTRDDIWVTLGLAVMGIGALYFFRSWRDDPPK